MLNGYLGGGLRPSMYGGGRGGQRTASRWFDVSTGGGSSVGTLSNQRPTTDGVGSAVGGTGQ